MIFRINLCILLVYLLFSFAGCGQKTSTAPEASQIIADSITAMEVVKTYQLNTQMTENYVVLGESTPQLISDLWQWQSQRQINTLKQELYLHMDSRDISNGNTTPYNFERYISGGWIYYSQSSPSVYGNTSINPWTKNAIGEQSPVSFSSEAQLVSQIELLRSSKAVILTGMGVINGNDCNIINYIPSAEAAADWVLSQEQFSGASMGWFRMPPERSRQIYIKAFKNGSVSLWIDKNSDLILKADISLLFDGVPGNIVRGDTGLITTEGQEKSTELGFDHIFRYFNGQWEFSDYNQPVNIQIPEEALKATEQP